MLAPGLPRSRPAPASTHSRGSLPPIVGSNSERVRSRGFFRKETSRFAPESLAPLGGGRRGRPGNRDQAQEGARGDYQRGSRLGATSQMAAPSPRRTAWL